MANTRRDADDFEVAWNGSMRDTYLVSLRDTPSYEPLEPVSEPGWMQAHDASVPEHKAHSRPQADLVLACFRECGPMTRVAACERLGRRYTSVSTAIDRLVKAGRLVATRAIAPPTGGRRATVWMMAAEQTEE